MATGEAGPSPRHRPPSENDFTMVTRSLRRMVEYAGLARDVYKLRHADEEQVSAAARKHLIERMGKMRGLPQKLGQLLSFSHAGEEDDPLAAADYARLQEAAEPLPLEVVRPLMEAAWGRPLEKVLREIEPHAHAASLGQVHRAILRDGREVAIKVQYPGIYDAVLADLKLLGWLSVPVGNLKRGFDLAAYRQVILDDIKEELDYRAEAASQRQFVDWADADPFLVVPRVVDSLSCENVLVSEWVEGDPWQTVCDHWVESDKKTLARDLLKFFLESLFARQMVHADLHPGNLRFQCDAGRVRLVLYDFGCVYRPTDDERLALLRLIRATTHRSEPPLPLFLKLGFNREYLEPLADKLPALCNVLFEPFVVEYPYDPADWHLGERVSDVLGDDRWNFRIAGPPAMVFLLRAFHGLIYYLQGLSAPVMWGRTLGPVLRAYADEMDRLDLPRGDVDHRDFSSLARYLKIRVQEGGRTKVQLTSRSEGIDDLENLLDDDLRAKILRQGIDLPAIVRDIRRRGYVPGPVFQWTEGTKQVEVWLE